MSLTSAQTDAASRAIVNVGVVRNAAAAAAEAASHAIGSTVYAQNAANMVAFYGAKMDEWAYGTTGLNQVAYGSRSFDNWLDDGDELAKSFAYWAKASAYTTARGMLANAPSFVLDSWQEYLAHLRDELGKLGDGAKWALYGGAALLALYLLARATGGAAELVKALKA